MLLKIAGNFFILTKGGVFSKVPTKFTLLPEKMLKMKIEEFLLLQNIMFMLFIGTIVKTIHSSLHSESEIILIFFKILFDYKRFLLLSFVNQPPPLFDPLIIMLRLGTCIIVTKICMWYVPKQKKYYVWYRFIAIARIQNIL